MKITYSISGKEITREEAAMFAGGEEEFITELNEVLGMLKDGLIPVNENNGVRHVELTCRCGLNIIMVSE